MGNENNGGDALSRTLDDVFAESDNLEKKQKMSRRAEAYSVSQRELEVALTVLLVDLASCDDDFDPREYQMLSNGLRRVFGTAKHEVQALVNQAKLAIANLRGTNKFAALLRDNLDEEKRRAILEVIDDVIMVDGVEDGFETYLRCKYADLLGLPTETD